MWKKTKTLSRHKETGQHEGMVVSVEQFQPMFVTVAELGWLDAVN
jgi:hypothetical protein